VLHLKLYNLIADPVQKARTVELVWLVEKIKISLGKKTQVQPMTYGRSFEKKTPDGICLSNSPQAMSTVECSWARALAELGE
jgi:hypothetical protein